jgi:hypothetical protein
MKICNYGCGQEGKYFFKRVKKWCCSKHWKKCPEQRKRTGEISKGKICSEETRRKIGKSNIGKNTGPLSEEHRQRIGEGLKDRILSIEHKKKIGEGNKGKTRSEEEKRTMNKDKKYTLKDYKVKYPFFFKVEELRENKNGEIQGHCKNHNCKNSKEKGGWFIPTTSQLYERIRQLEHINGCGGSYLYCCQKCKDMCPLYYLKGDPYKDNNLPFTSTEKEIFNKLVLKRDNELCYYCDEHHATIVHHLRPKKLEPFFALDPDYAISVCIKCHYKYGHPTGSEYSTGNLAKIVCSVESQKFLNQKLK